MGRPGSRPSAGRKVDALVSGPPGSQQKKGSLAYVYHQKKSFGSCAPGKNVVWLMFATWLGQPASQSVSQQAASQPASQSASQPARQPGSQPASQRASQPASQPVQPAACQPASQPAWQKTIKNNRNTSGAITSRDTEQSSPVVTICRRVCLQPWAGWVVTTIDTF